MVAPDSDTQQPSRTQRTFSAAEHAVLKALPGRLRTARNVNDLVTERMTLGQRLAKAVANALGSWWFIGIQSVIISVWIGLNAVAWKRQWDPYPFVLLNLALACQSVYSGAIIIMSQNRQAAKDRLEAEEDYRVNLRAEMEIAAMQARLDQLAGEQWATLLAIQKQQLDVLLRLDAETKGTGQPATGDGGPRPAGQGPIG
jgi:uncharacterized membrane protein